MFGTLRRSSSGNLIGSLGFCCEPSAGGSCFITSSSTLALVGCGCGLNIEASLISSTISGETVVSVLIPRH